MRTPNDIHAYDRDIPPSPELAWKIAQFFADNYPEVSEPQARAEDLASHGSAEAILERLSEGKIFLLQIGARQKIQGLLEWTPTQKEGYISAQLEWIMTDPPLRGMGIAHMLHRYFLEQAVHLKQATEQTVALELNVHKDNSVRTFLRKLGYQLWSQSSEDSSKVSMGHEL